MATFFFQWFGSERQGADGHEGAIHRAGGEAGEHGLHTRSLRTLIGERGHSQAPVRGMTTITNSRGSQLSLSGIPSIWPQVAALEKTIDSRTLDIQILERRVS